MQINEEEIGKLPEKEFRIMIVKMIKNLENKMEKMQDSVNRDLEELKNKPTETNNTITEIKNTLLLLLLLLLSCFSRVRLRATPWTAAYQGSPSMGLGKNTGVGCHFLLQNTLERISSRISEAEEQISELEDKMVEITSEEQNKVNRMKRTGDSLRDLWENIKCTRIRIIGVSEE